MLREGLKGGGRCWEESRREGGWSKEGETCLSVRRGRLIESQEGETREIFIEFRR